MARTYPPSPIVNVGYGSISEALNEANNHRLDTYVFKPRAGMSPEEYAATEIVQTDMGPRVRLYRLTFERLGDWPAGKVTHQWRVLVAGRGWTD